MFKIGSMFSLKAQTPKSIRSRVMYQFICAACNDSCVGETARHFETRVNEHLTKHSQPSSIFQHLEKNEACRKHADKNCFKIIDCARTKFTLELKEAIHTQWINPQITKQKDLTLNLNV